MELSLDPVPDPIKAILRQRPAKQAAARPERHFFYYAIKVWAFCVYALVIPLLPLVMVYLTGRWLGRLLKR